MSYTGWKLPWRARFLGDDGPEDECGWAVVDADGDVVATIESYEPEGFSVLEGEMAHEIVRAVNARWTQSMAKVKP